MTKKLNATAMVDGVQTWSRSMKTRTKLAHEMHTLTSLKGSYTGTLLECLEWQAEHQGAFASIDDVMIDDLEIAEWGDPNRDIASITPQEAEKIVQQWLLEDM